MISSASRPPSSEQQTDQVLGELAEELAGRLRSGEAVDLDAFLAEHPEQAEALRRLLPAIRVMADLGRSAAHQAAGAPAADPLAEWGVLGDYRIVREVGRGGMGVVYEAEQISLHRRVALKVLPFAAALDPRHLQRFHNEAQAAAGLHHTHIVPVFAVGVERGVHYYAMQFIEGRALSEAIRELRQLEPRAAFVPSSPDAAGPVPPAEAGETTAPPLVTPGSLVSDRSFFQGVARLGIQAAEALEYANSLGVIHRDIKPANLLLDAHGDLWVTDFGLARLHADAGLTMTGDILGTLRYMSPEQALARRGQIDHRTDVYSLGVTLYELLTLRPAFEGHDRQELLRQIAFEEPPPPRRINPKLPRELETIVLKAMAKEPEGRYATAQELADDLRRFLEHRPIRARRPTLPERAAKWVRRHPGTVMTAVIVLAVATAALAVTTVLVGRERAEVARQRDAAKAQRRRARAAVDTMYTRFAERWLADQPRMTNLQREFLEEALRYYEEFARGTGSDAEALRDVAAAHLHVGEIRGKLGRHREAEASYRTALALWDRLTSGPAPAPEDLRRAAVTALNLGNELQASGRLKESEALYRRSLILASRLPSGPGVRPWYLTARAEGLANLGFVLAAEGRSAEAEASYRAALPVYEAALAAAPDEAKTRAHLANCLNNLGNLALGSGRLDEAEKAYRRAGGLFGELARDFPGWPEAAETQAYILSNLAETLRRVGRSGEMEALLRRAVAIQERLAHDFPTIPDYRNELAASLGGLAIRHHDAGRIDEERDALERVASILDDLVQAYPSVVEYRQHLVEFLRNRGNLLAEEGRFAEAAESYRRAMTLAEKNVTDFPENESLHLERSVRWYQLIRFLTDCPDARVRDLDAAIRLARRAVASDPKQPRLWEALGVALYRAGDVKPAAEALERSLSLESSNPIAGFALALTRWKLGDKAEARACYDRAVTWQKSPAYDAEATRRYRNEAFDLIEFPAWPFAGEEPRDRE